ncbi:GNAT family N-acetyltransferase [Pelagovum pacificum]|uniref:Acetyltransferase n=1 Tax=Pelagovum pacificum TaxID=2588711 RepID=A0A5C5GGS9_9RHOB|nr:GNAT family N-acetyltransferase [Pelagovum pacificum]QQA43087.1 GNAT family N-acetyltransferase [Pelagovum pacificum]TNY33770.1 acetyltransferase [Pelagovum pacificum]
MTGAASYQFRPVTMDDLPLLAAWRSTAHVRQWWGAFEPYSPEALSDARVARWIVSTAGRPFAFIQDYSVHGWDDHHFAALPEGSRGIDQFIGDPAMVGIGHGTAFIGARIRALFENGAPVVATDPHPDNARAIAVCRKLGFVPSGPPQETAWGPILPMLARRPGQ